MTQIPITAAPVWVNNNIAISRTGTIQHSVLATFCQLNGGRLWEGLTQFSTTLDITCILHVRSVKVSGLCAGMLIFLLIVQEEVHQSEMECWGFLK